MSDHSISIVPKQSAYPDKDKKAKEILEYAGFSYRTKRNRELICPHCREDIANEDWDFLSEWGDNISNNLTCPFCKVSTISIHACVGLQ